MHWHMPSSSIRRCSVGGVVEDPTVDIIANGEWSYKVNTDLVSVKSVSVTRKGTEYSFNIDGLTILNQKTNWGSLAINFMNNNDKLLDASKMANNSPSIKLDDKYSWVLNGKYYPNYHLQIGTGSGAPLALYANTFYSELHFNFKV